MLLKLTVNSRSVWMGPKFARLHGPSADPGLSAVWTSPDFEHQAISLGMKSNSLSFTVVNKAVVKQLCLWTVRINLSLCDARGLTCDTILSMEGGQIQVSRQSVWASYITGVLLMLWIIEESRASVKTITQRAHTCQRKLSHKQCGAWAAQTAAPELYHKKLHCGNVQKRNTGLLAVSLFLMLLFITVHADGSGHSWT